MNKVSWTVFENRLLAAKTSVDAGTLAVRLTTVLLALGILFWRTPNTFINPQFWGEDVVFFHGARIDGWTSIAHLVAGYLTSIQYLVAVLASYASAVVAPAIYCTAAVFLTLLVVWLVTSPRLDLPSKPLLALAVVVVPMGGEELGQLCNIQWVLPIGAFAMLFMRASNSNAVLAGEVIYIGLMATSGPFSIFLAPMFAWQTFLADTAAERHRLILLTAVVASGGLLQGLEIATHPVAIAPEPYSRTLWVTIPLRRIMTTFSVASRHLEGLSGAAVGTICLAVAAVLACMRPYRTQKIFMLLFSLLIAIGGMYKFRDALAGQISGQRYFYVASVFSLWFICCLSARPPVRMGLSAFVAIVQLIDLLAIRDHSKIEANLQWPVWASYISSGLPLIIPSSPLGWYVGLPASSSGPLASFAPWVGRNITEFSLVDPLACKGVSAGKKELRERDFPGDISSDPSIKAWITAGWAWDAKDKAVQLVAITDAAGKVVGFGFPGFETQNPAHLRSGWNAVYYARDGSAQAFGIVEDGKRACRLSDG